MKGLEPEVEKAVRIDHSFHFLFHLVSVLIGCIFQRLCSFHLSVELSDEVVYDIFLFSF